MFLGIEIGATKLQFGVGCGDGSPLVELRRCDVLVHDGAAGVRRQIEAVAPELIARHGVRAIGFGFGGPVDAAAGRTVKSHQVDGWEDFPLRQWCHEALGQPAALANDSDSAGLAEALFGAGRGAGVVFYTNVGSGIGGALVVAGKLYTGSRGIASELGHLRPGPAADRPEQTVESIASGFGIAAAAQMLLKQARLREGSPQWLRDLTVLSASSVLLDEGVADLLRRCGGEAERLSGRMVGQAAAEGNKTALAILDRALETFGWAIAQMITLLAPEVVVVGGGVPLLGEALFFAPLRRQIDRYAFPPLVGTFRIAPSQLGEEVVVHGALAVAASTVVAPKGNA